MSSRRSTEAGRPPVPPRDRRPADAPPSPPGRVGALDGLRAIAVSAVVVYHVDHSLLPGGFVGVDLFFVLSGYLITTLLIAEHDREGSISLRSFWARRARRLWPLAWCTLAAVAAASVTGWWGDDRQRTLPVEVASAFAHIANWYQTGHGGYVQSIGAPSPLRHFWSLAIEEQFYLVWPILFVALLAMGARRRWIVPCPLVALAGISVAAGFRSAGNSDRAYLGTDVRMVALVVGALLGWVFRRRPMMGPATERARTIVLGWGMAGGAFLIISAATLDPADERLARGGFAAIALAAAGVIAAALTWRPAAFVLSSGPIAHLGRLSFAVYLVHWPLLVALGPDRPLALRLLVAFPITIGVAAVLHRVIERPVVERPPRPFPLAAGAVALLVLTVIGLTVAVPDGPTPTETVAASLGQVPDPTTVAAPATSQPSETSLDAPLPGAPPIEAPATEVPAAEVPATEAPPTTACIPAATPGTAFETTGRFDPNTVNEIDDPSAVGCGGQLKVLVVGDSTGRGAANGLAALADPGLQIWDRTTLGCSLGGEDCPSWREPWGVSVAGIDPDVVLVYSGVVDDFHGVRDASFLSDEERSLRLEQLREAASMLSSAGAKVYFVTPAVPKRPNGLFFCDSDGSDTRCDPAWVSEWNDSVRAAAAASDAGVIDVGGWITARGATSSDRPDGLHLAGPALVEHAAWLVPQLVPNAS